ncbi:MAG: hypothetical protein U0984_03255 [Prosthecobacter sp.]|nr:hypothetical protein [Prosthecobacter sp.]
MKAEILSFSGDGEAEVLYTWTLAEDGTAVCSSALGQARMEEDGIVEPGKGLIFPKDGRAFIQGLPREFSGSRARARLVAEE